MEAVAKLGVELRRPVRVPQEEVDGAAQAGGRGFAAGEDEDVACESEFFGGKPDAFGVFSHVATASQRRCCERVRIPAYPMKSFRSVSELSLFPSFWST